MLQLAVGQVEAEPAAAVRAHPARALAGAAADLEHVEAGHVAEDPELVLGVALGPPDEAGVTEERPVRGLVLVGVAVPVGPVGAARLALGDGAPLDPHGLRQVILHARSVLPGRGATATVPVAPCEAMSELGPVLRPLEGGHSGRTFLGEVGGERAVVTALPAR